MATTTTKQTQRADDSAQQAVAATNPRPPCVLLTCIKHSQTRPTRRFAKSKALSEERAKSRNNYSEYKRGCPRRERGNAVLT